MKITKGLLGIYLHLIHLAVLVSCQTQIDGCQEDVYQIITDDRRSAGYRNDIIDFPLCDRFNTIQLGNWYRFKNSVGGRIPEDCVPTHHCMTTYPIWMDGTHPTVLNGVVTRRVCGNHGYDGTSNVDQCCAWEANIQVKLCPGENGGENFYVYKLVPPNTCYSSYCGGTEVPPCQADFVLQDGECVEKCPEQGGFPLMSDPIELPGENPALPPNDFEFTCNIFFPLPTNGMEKFEVTWYLNEEEMTNRNRTILDSSTGLIARIRGTELKGQMGKTIQCRVRAFRKEYMEFNMCSAHFSNSYKMDVVPINLGYGLELTTEVTTKNSNEPGPEIVPREKSNLTLIAGAAAGGTVFLLIVLVLVVFLYHKKHLKGGHNIKKIYDDTDYASEGRSKAEHGTVESRASSTDKHNQTGPRTIPNIYTGDPSTEAFANRRGSSSYPPTFYQNDVYHKDGNLQM